MKIYPGLIASTILLTDDLHSWRIWLWETQEDLKRWAERYAAGPKGKGAYDKTEALFSPVSCNIHVPAQHLGEIHFVKDNWDLELVVHELVHAQFHYIRMQVEDFVRPLYQFYKEWMEWEEDLCYPFGKWINWVYNWLWKKNPNPRWTRGKRED